MHQKIDEELKFNSLLAQWNHFGNVYIEFWISPKGILLKDKIRAKAEDHVLKVHTMRALRRALKVPFAETKWNPRGESIQIKAKFEYRFDTSEMNFKKQKTFSKRLLVFDRTTMEKPISTDFRTHLATGGLHYDVFLMVERWEKYNHKKMLVKTGFDPFDEYRKDPDYRL